MESKNTHLNYSLDWVRYPTKVPILDVGERNGETGYIDYITPDEYKFPIFCGVDIFKRPFVCIRLRAIISYSNSDTREIIFHQTFFHRYNDFDTLIVGCGNYGNNFMETVGGMDLQQKIFLYRLVFIDKNISLTDSECELLRLFYRQRNHYKRTEEDNDIVCTSVTMFIE